MELPCRDRPSDSRADVFTLEAVNALAAAPARAHAAPDGAPRGDRGAPRAARQAPRAHARRHRGRRRRDPPEVRELKQRPRRARSTRYQAAWNELEEMGAVLKDPRMGLVDFYGQVDGKLRVAVLEVRRGRRHALPRPRRGLLRAQAHRAHDAQPAPQLTPHGSRGGRAGDRSLSARARARPAREPELAGTGSRASRAPRPTSCSRATPSTSTRCFRATSSRGEPSSSSCATSRSPRRARTT